MIIKFHPDALDEFDRAADYYEIEASIETSYRFRSVVEKAARHIATNPRMFPEIDHDIRRCLTRSFSYALLYSIEQHYVLVVAVMHTSREPDYWRYRLD